MPIYEYRCTKCGDETEVMQKITEGPLRKCRKCSGRLKKLISRTSFQLKGGGWYDSGYTKSSSGSGSDKKGSSTTGSPAEKKSDKTKGSGKVETKTASA